MFVEPNFRCYCLFPFYFRENNTFEYLMFLFFIKYITNFLIIHYIFDVKMHGNKRTTSSEFVYLYTFVVNLMWCILKQKKRRGFVCQMVTFMLSESVLSFFLSYPSDIRQLYWVLIIPDSGRVPIKPFQQRRLPGDSNWGAKPSRAT